MILFGQHLRGHGKKVAHCPICEIVFAPFTRAYVLIHIEIICVSTCFLSILSCDLSKVSTDYARSDRMLKLLENFVSNTRHFATN